MSQRRLSDGREPDSTQQQEPSLYISTDDSADIRSWEPAPNVLSPVGLGSLPSQAGTTTFTSSTTTGTTVFDHSRARCSEDVLRQRQHYRGCCCQLGITIKRMLILMIRQPCSFICELLIPIIFVAGTVALWAIFGYDKYPAMDYYDPTNIASSAQLYQSATQGMCYNSTITGGTPIGALGDCSLLSPLVTKKNPMLCAGPISGAPPGFCSLLATAGATSWGWMNLATGSSTTIPSLDELIPMQWTNRILYDRTKISTVWGRTAEAALFSTGALYFSPDTPETQALVAHLNATSQYFPYVYGGIGSADEMDKMLKQRTSRDTPNWGIVQVNSLAPNSFDVMIRLNATALPRTKLALAEFYVGGVTEDGSELYILSGFATLQTTIYKYYMNVISGLSTMPPPQTVAVPAPTRAYNDQKFLAYGGQLCPLILVLGFLYPVSQMSKRIVLEKELRLREAMLIMGLPETVMYSAWLIIYVVQYAVVSLVITVLLKLTYTPHSNAGIIFFLFFFFCLSIISLSGLIAAFFSKARLAAILSPLIYFVLSIPLFAMQDAGDGVRYGVSLLSPSGLAVGIGLLFDHELAGGMTTQGMTYFRDHPNMLVCMVIIFVDFLLYGVLMVYFEAVLPKDWGTRKHPLFFILDPIRWCTGRSAANRDNMEDGRAADGVYEEVPDSATSAVRMVGLVKKYGSGKKRFLAVNNFHWSMREGEISVLLGHNGAGKSTTMNMMTGMIPADRGDCYIYGHSVRNDLVKARGEIGFCPQHNILWPDLTCREHLWYFASVKGLRGRALDEAIDEMLEGVDLMDKSDYKSKNLSGGQQRKLSVAIAFVGGSRLIFLDEPTAGMDVAARRHTWGLLRSMSVTHSILLSTHFMDEADLLGDNIAIMYKGRLQCTGSNTFLKSKLGAGYVLTMSVVAHVNRASISNAVRSYIPEAKQLGCGAGEVAFQLPTSSKAIFPDLLAAIEERGPKLGVNGYAMSATTLEEIFIQLAKGQDQDDSRTVGTPEQSGSSSEGAMSVDAPKPSSDVWNVQLIEEESGIMFSQFKSMLAKRFWNVLRDRRTQFFQIVCPVACVLLAMLLMLIKLMHFPDVILSSNLYDTSVEVDVDASCASDMDLSIPFSSRASTYTATGASTISALSAFMLSTYDKHPLHEERYGGLVCSDTLPSIGSAAGVIYNSSALHELPISVYNLYNGFYRKSTGASSNLYTVVGTMPQTHTEKEVTDSLYAMMIAAIIMIPFTFIPSTFVSWIVKERECKARHLQNVSGLFFSIYWLTNFLFDIACYIITMFLVIIVFLIFNRQEYIARDNVGATIVLFFLYGVSGVSMAYAVGFFFKEHATAQNTVMLANFIAGFLLVLCVTMLSLIESTKDIVNVLRWIFRIVPAYCVGEGISNLSVLKLERAFGTTKTAWSMDVIGWPCVYMALELPLFVGITLFIDHPGRRQRAQRLFHNPDKPAEEISDEDPDVVAEREDVLNNPERSSDLVSVRHLRKVYPNGKVAVRNITFGVKPGEVFGFLGTNGAGKTTTISILCQEFYPTSGRGSICGNDIVSESRQALRCIGYCPQFDATLDLLTVEEHLWLYAGVRAIAYAARPGVVSGLLSLCELTDYKDTKAHALSGGNRRKLSVAISLIGGPRVVFLDEPSAGMDPVARRGLWTAIETVADNCSVVLTTHHLEEVEALAHRVAIMVDGALHCIGNKTHLKTKFGTGFEVNVRIQPETDAVKSAVEKFFAERFPGSSCREYRARRFTYEMPSDTKLSLTFKLLEEEAAALSITDYSVSQTSIEQVFLQISEEAERRHEEELAEANMKRGCCGCCC